MEFSSDALIKAITDAIKAELTKSGKSVADVKVEQDAENAAREKEIKKAEIKKKEEKKLEDVISSITDYIKENKSDMDKIKPIIAKTRELGYDNPTMIDNIKDAETVAALIV